MTAYIKGKIQKGIGESSNTVKEQMPFFAKCFPEVTICKAATINILLEKPLVVISPDFTTEPLPWHPAFNRAASDLPSDGFNESESRRGFGSRRHRTGDKRRRNGHRRLDGLCNDGFPGCGI